jgi:hypothetical protein
MNLTDRGIFDFFLSNPACLQDLMEEGGKVLYRLTGNRVRTAEVHGCEGEFLGVIKADKVIHLFIPKIMRQSIGKRKGLKGKGQMLQNVTRVQKMITIRSITVFPGTTENNGSQEKGKGRKFLQARYHYIGYLG